MISSYLKQMVFKISLNILSKFNGTYFLGRSEESSFNRWKTER